MLIENPESLQTWLTSYLEPLCDADPQALAQYVMALIGKDKPTKDLKHILTEQLEVFLQKETAPFVEVLFETIDNKSYLDSVNFDNSDDASPDRLPSGLDAEEDASQSPVDNYDEHCNLDAPHQSFSAEYEPKSLPDPSGSNVPGDQIASSSHVKRSYQNRERSKSRSNSRSRSPIPQNRHRPQDVDMRKTTGYMPYNQPENGDSRGHFAEQRNRQTGQSSRGMSRRYESSSTLSLPHHLGGGYRRNRDGSLSKRSRVSSKPLNEEDGVEKERQFSFAKICDSDDRIFCMRRDSRQFDPGSDPVVLDCAVSSVVFGVPTNGASDLADTSGSAGFRSEPYDPEAPGIDDPIGSGPSSLSAQGAAPMLEEEYFQEQHISQHPFWRPIAPPLTPGSTSSSFIPSMSQSNEPRELVGSKDSSLTSFINNTDSSKLVNITAMDTSAPSTVQSSANLNHNKNSPKNLFKRGGRLVRRNRGGYIKRMVNNESADKCTLEVRKIPPNLNTIANLNSHFSKFGSIVNLQVCYEGDSEAALVQFASHSEALSAHRCTEAVLNNRFIKVFWHSKDQSSQQQQQQSLSHSSNNQGPVHHHHKSSYDSSLRAAAANGNIINDSSKSDQTNLINKPSVKDRLGVRHAIDSVSTNVTSSGSISRTVFNPSLLKKQYPSSTSSAASSTTISAASATLPTTTTSNVTTCSNLLFSGVKQEASGITSTSNTASEPVIRRKDESRKDKLLKILDLQKKRQNILVSCMQQQKLLIDKLQKAKTDKDKTQLRSMIDLLNKQIKGLESDIKKDAEIILIEAAKLPTTGKIKSKIQVEKELLDVEMDFYNELHKGATASELHKKLQELKIKAKPYCMNDIRSTKAMIKRFAEMKGALRDRNRQANHTLAKNFENLRKVDRRTRKIFVEGIPEDDNSILLAHLSQSAEIESLESTPQGLLVTFKTRRDAEMALPLISTVKLKDQAPKLKATWFDEVKAKSDAELEMAHNKNSSELELFIGSDINMNNDESKINDEATQDINREEDDEDEGKNEDLNEGEIAEDEEKYSNEPQIEGYEPADEEEADSSATEIDDDPRNLATDDEEDDDENRITLKGAEKGVEGLKGDNDNENDTTNDEEHGRPTIKSKEARSRNELQMDVGKIADLLEEEDTDDEDESRAWRR